MSIAMARISENKPDVTFFVRPTRLPWPGVQLAGHLNTHSAVLMITPGVHIFIGYPGYLSCLYLTQLSLIDYRSDAD